MDKIYRIKYTDAHYLYTKLCPNNTKLSKYEACGYLKEEENHLIIRFVKKTTLNKKNDLQVDNTVIKGLLIPHSALLSNVNKFNINFGNFKSTDRISVLWEDVVYVANQQERKVSIMQTEGFIYKIKSDHIVLKNPSTVYHFPISNKKHPEKDPYFYVIPKSFILKMSIIK